MKSKKITPELAKELEALINRNLDTSYFPYVKGKSIRIGHIIVRETRFGFLVFDTKNNKEVDKMFCKTSAVALAKQETSGSLSNPIEYIKKLDKEIEKNYNDAIFYKHTMRVTKDDTKFFVAQTRYDIAASKTRYAKEELDKYIYV
jgi:hypothetical protein